MNATATHAAPRIHRRVWIDDGRWVSIRPIERADASGLSDFYERLSGESKRRRFLGSSGGAIAALSAEFAQDGNGLVAVLHERGARDGAVVGHASVQAAGGGEAEVAYAVADELQRRGIGRALVDESIHLARARGLRRVTASFFVDNVPMRRLLREGACAVIGDELDAGVEEIALAVDAVA